MAGGFVVWWRAFSSCLFASIRIAYNANDDFAKIKISMRDDTRNRTNDSLCVKCHLTLINEIKTQPFKFGRFLSKYLLKYRAIEGHSVYVLTRLVDRAGRMEDKSNRRKSCTTSPSGTTHAWLRLGNWEIQSPRDQPLTDTIFVVDSVV